MVVLIFGTSKRSKNIPNSVGNIANIGKNPGKNGPDVGEKLHFEVVLRQQQQHFWCWVVLVVLLLGWVPDQSLVFVVAVVVWLSF